MEQDSIKLDVIKKFTNSLSVKDGKTITTLDEDDYFEFKKGFNSTQNGMSKAYLKTMAGLANNKGGIIIFGIDPDNQELVGIKDKYENLDNKYVNMVVSEFLDGLSSFFFFTHRHDGKLLGFLNINQPTFKPVIVRSNFNDETDSYTAGDIYYRYPGEVLKIKPSDLRALMSKEINRHAQHLIQQINTIVDIGPENVAIINSKTGEVNANNAKLSLSPEILSKLNLIMEGHFVEKEGAPAYVIKGNIELEGGGSIAHIIKEPTSLHNRDYHLSFLNDACPNPKSMLKDIVYRDTFYLPILNLIKKSELTIEQACQILKEQNGPDVKKTTKKNIIEKLSNLDLFLVLKEQGTIRYEVSETGITEETGISEIKAKYNFKGNVDKTIIRTLIYNQLKNGQHSSFKETHLKEYIEAFSHLPKEVVNQHKEFCLGELKSILEEHSDKLTNEGAVKTAYRKTICLLDYYLFN
ncbi:MAG: ATP-binding protein [Crocinitomicaceae bacterium]